jgi:hypothetical protein
MKATNYLFIYTTKDAKIKRYEVKCLFKKDAYLNFFKDVKAKDVIDFEIHRQDEGGTI